MNYSSHTGIPSYLHRHKSSYGQTLPAVGSCSLDLGLLGFFGVVVLGLFVGLDLGCGFSFFFVLFFLKLWKNNFPIIENVYLK